MIKCVFKLHEGTIGVLCQHMKKNILFWVAAVIVIILLATSMSKGDAGKGDVVRVGVLGSLTGNAAYYGQSNMKGAEIGLAAAREKFPKLKMELYHQDNLFTPKGGIDAYNALRSKNDIDAVIVQASNVAVAVQPLAMKDGILMIAASTLANNYSTPHDLSFRLTPKGDLEAAPAMAYMQSKGYKKIAILSMTNEIGVSLADSLTKAAETTEGGTNEVKVVAKETFAPDAVDFRTQLSKIRAESPDVIYLGALGSHSAQILKQAEELGIRSAYMGFRAVEDPVFAKNAGDLASKVVYTNAFDPESDRAETKTFVDAWNAKYPGEEPTAYAAEAYQSVLFMAEAFDACGKDYGCIQKKLEGFKDHPSVFGPISYDENGDISYAFLLKTVKDGKFVKLSE